MQKEIDINKVARQHLEMEEFFCGFTVKGVATPTTPDQKESTMTKAEKQKELDKIFEEVRVCCQCELVSTRNKVVPGEGNPNARIMFVGEAPGADEDAQGRPFVGRAGKLLENIIIACGLKRSDVFIGNILKCRPPGNRDPKAEEIICCLPFLQRQIEIISPEVIVALGAHAAKTLLNSNDTIGHLRGHFHEYVTGPGKPPIKFMATYHPAYLLRNYSQENRKRVWEDMKKVLIELNLPVPKK
ncbi:MAG: uracil-DNA glycosylase [Sedimentisphaerales bacterium]|nr:uracil-DNA glycosylase [Sedimentisphaerales bacterium]